MFRSPFDWRLSLTVIAMAVTVIPVAAWAAPPTGQGGGEIGVEAVSTRPDLVTGGDVLIRIRVPVGVDPDRLQVRVRGADVSDAFLLVDDGELLGLVDGLRPGSSTMVVTAPRARATTLELTNHPAAGPVLYPQAQPYFCRADIAFGLPIVDADTCGVDTRVTWMYRTIGGAWGTFDPDSGTPADVAETTTTKGVTVPFTIRLEEGTINRAVYQIAVLDDPTVPGPDPWMPEEGWNRRLVYTFGGGCNHGWHQGSGTGGVLDAVALGLGYAVASSTLNVLDNNCNDVVSAETALMVKEHFIETVGEPDHTIGWGGSGGAIQQYLLTENYPGILDGILPNVSFPDAVSILPGISDCRLLLNYFASTSIPWSDAEQTAVSGFATIGTCTSWNFSFVSRIVPDEGCNSAIPLAVRYDPVLNPDGLRCTVHDYMVDIFGRDASTGFALRALDGVGLQYGLEALRDGAITAEQFVDLNEHIGGYDIDARIVTHRTVADPAAIEAAYSTGRITSGAHGLATTPIIDFRIYLDPLGDIHDRFRSFTTRQRLIAANGHAHNHVIWTAGSVPTWSQAGYQALGAMDQWLTALAADGSDRPQADKVIDARPAGLVDGCWLPDGTRVDEPATYDGPGICNTIYPANADPRLVAGAPISSDIVKCQLAPLDPADYPVAFTTEQWQRLEVAFPDGVCDWSQPGVGQLAIADTWRSYLSR
jgi:hypothetical protein